MDVDLLIGEGREHRRRDLWAVTKTGADGGDLGDLLVEVHAFGAQLSCPRLKRQRAAFQSGADIEKLILSAQDKLRLARAKRGLPRDNKELAAWNGLALAAFAKAAQITQERRYHEAAQTLRDFLAKQLWDGKALARSRVQGKASG